MVEKIEIRSYKFLGNDLEIENIKKINLIVCGYWIIENNSIKYIFEKDCRIIETIIRGKNIKNLKYFTLPIDKIKTNIVKYLKIINPQIEDFIYIKNKLYIKLKAKEGAFDIDLSQDFKKLFNLIVIICSKIEQMSSVDNAFFVFLINNIANEIYYKLYEKMWEILIEIARDKRIQIFADTCNHDMIKSFKNVSSQNKNDNYFNFIKLF